MERGVVVGGLMICGSFLIAASLNRSAVEETPPEEPIAGQAPMARPMTAPPTAARLDESRSAACASEAKDPPVAADPTSRGDLPGNGREACPQ